MAFKMKAGKEGPMKKNFPSVFKIAEGGSGSGLGARQKAKIEERERKGEIGRQWVLGDVARMTAKHLSDSFIKNIETTFEKWKPREKYILEVI